MKQVGTEQDLLGLFNLGEHLLGNLWLLVQHVDHDVANLRHERPPDLGVAELVLCLRLEEGILESYCYCAQESISYIIAIVFLSSASPVRSSPNEILDKEKLRNSSIELEEIASFEAACYLASEFQKKFHRIGIDNIDSIHLEYIIYAEDARAEQI